MNNNDQYFLTMAIDLACRNVANGQGGPFGAVIVKDGELIASGTNLVTANSDPTAHAEIIAIRNATAKLNCFELSGYTIFSSCEPCPMCLGAIYWARLDRLVFAADRKDAAAAGFDDDFIYQQLALPTTDGRLLKAHHVIANTLAPFELWRQSNSKIRY